ncbi:MAG TPA: aminotransferase class I/II-fold pyridoxal phosphate-dependent enzyme [Candidatus Blautia faecigallinarum]|uniref:Aminotransferase class I/II-fold pyridoxal phosphate-dependent enzyme n=1 Tax=Candidatus Blautia faecigallinarum TaxID=2838488 RepID=A0A9D2ITJ4_9FIRM|nr:aminotransferase class I/II-fold pyridoxal phosphate-dependent enzyme [Candidatus Blautia faecigallinarum]
MKSIQAKRLDHFSTGIFADIDEKKEKLIAKGKKIYNLSIGTPDFPPEEHVIKAVMESAGRPEAYKYSLRDLPELLEAVVDYYKERFGVTLTSDMVTGVHGSQEGIGHVCMALCDPEDVILLPNPGYPIFEAGAYLSGAEQYQYDLLEENNFLPVLSDIPEEIAKRAKVMVVSYPYNPVCKAAPDSFYDELIAFAKKYDIFIIHDNAYSDIIFDGRKGGSFLQHPGAMEVGAEFFSLSKSFNVTGARLSFMIGRKDAIDAMKLLRSQIDFGIFIPAQMGAIAALKGSKDGVKRQCRLYQERRDALCGGFRSIGWNVPDSEGTMFVWAPVPKGYTSRSFTMALMEKAGVLCTPGDAFGSRGEGYVRFALVLPPEELKKVVQAVKESGVLPEEE